MSNALPPCRMLSEGFGSGPSPSLAQRCGCGVRFKLPLEIALACAVGFDALLAVVALIWVARLRVNPDDFRFLSPTNKGDQVPPHICNSSGFKLSVRPCHTTNNALRCASDASHILQPSR